MAGVRTTRLALAEKSHEGCLLWGSFQGSLGFPAGGLRVVCVVYVILG